MLMSVISGRERERRYPELSGARVLITGLGPDCGVDIARAFAEHGARLVLHLARDTPETDGLLEVIARDAQEVKATSEPLSRAGAAMRLAQAAAQAYGGLDAAINLIRLDDICIDAAATEEDIEAAVADLLRAAFHITEVAANRMRLTWSEGAVLNVLAMPAPNTAADVVLCQMARSALAAMTRGEAERWADHAVRINAVAPQISGLSGDGPSLTSQADIAALALFLASKGGTGLSGQVFDAAGVATRAC